MARPYLYHYAEAFTRSHKLSQAIARKELDKAGFDIASTAAAWVYGTRLGDASGEDGQPRDPEAAEAARSRLAWLQWATPALTGAVLVLDAQLGEQQRGAAGLLDRRW